MSKRPNEITASFGYKVKYRIGTKAKKNSDGNPIDCLYFRVISPDDSNIVATGFLTADDIMGYCLENNTNI